jgi:hypothetical protein
MVANFNPQAAFFTSDNIDKSTNRAPYALMSHGTYQDSEVPEAWPYGLFPNYRNVLWSCNWSHLNTFHTLTEYTVETFVAPVSISNGTNDLGISQMSSEKQRMFIDLFEKRKNKRMEITWIEEAGSNCTYQGRPIKR